MGKTDITHKSFFENAEWFADLMNVAYFEGEEIVEATEIRKANKEKYGNTLKDGEFICGFRKKDRLAPVFTLVLYWGDKEWDAATSLQDMVDIPAANHNMQEKLKALVPNYRIKVFDLNNVKDFSSFKTALRIIFEFYSHRNSGEALKEYIEDHKEEVKNLDEDSRFLLATMLKEKRLKQQLLKRNNERNEKEEDDMCQAIDELIAEGRAEGKAEGKAEAILILLREMGSVDDETCRKVKGETDESTLEKWLRIAAKVENMNEFKKAI